MELFGETAFISAFPNAGRFAFAPFTARCPDCGARVLEAERCVRPADRTRATAAYSICCDQGRVTLPPIQDPPGPLATLLREQGPRAAAFRNNIRAYNASLRFASLGCRVDESLIGAGVYAFRIQGQMHHHLGPPMPGGTQDPRFAQIFFRDSDFEYELGRRLHWTSSVLPEVRALQEMIHLYNPYYATFLTSVERLRQAGPARRDIRITLVNVSEERDPRTTNAPSAPEIAVLMLQVSYEGWMPQRRDIAVWCRGGGIQRLVESHPAYDPPHYVLLFTRGEQGRRQEFPRNVIATGPHARNRVSMCDFYAYRLCVRDGSTDLLFFAGELFHQYLVDAWAKIELERLNFPRTNQRRVRADLYSGLQDALQEQDADLESFVRRVILPPTFNGGERHLRMMYHDALAVIRKLGRPSFFVTMTCHPNWPEVRGALLLGQRHTDRPDRLARVFSRYMEEVLRRITQDKVLGDSIAHFLVIEFQKRGLPHAHIVLVATPETRPRAPEAYYRCVWPEIPDPVTRPALHSIITTRNMHGPCGPSFPNQACMQEGTCRWKFPQPFCNHATEDSYGFVQYRRRDTGLQCERRGCIFDNRWVVPCNPALSLRASCHVNVLVRSSINAAKYPFNYLYKGADHATIRQEITMDGRTTTNVEAT